MRIRRSLAVAGLMTIAAVASGCLITSGTGPLNVTTYDAPDPAGVVLTSSTSQIYTTDSGGRNIPTFTMTSTGTSYTTGTVTDALPTLPSWVVPYGAEKHTDTWAPTVRFIGGQYVMLFTGSMATNLCIGEATSPTAAGSFTPVNNGGWCYPGYNALDPSLFVAADGSVWMYWSKQSGGGGAGRSEIDVQQMSSDGLSRKAGSSPITMLTFSDAATIGGGPVPTNGLVENPAMVADPYNGFDLIASVGVWGDSSYHTVELPCTGTSSGCLPNDGAIQLQTNASMNGPGGASVLQDTTPVGNTMVFAARTGTSGAARLLWATPTASYNCNSGAVGCPNATTTTAN